MYVMHKMAFYYASRKATEKVVRHKDVLSWYPHLVCNLELYHSKTNQKWEIDDLRKPYLLTSKMEFKKDRTPDRAPYIYRGYIDYSQLDVGKEYPYLFTVKENENPISVSLMEKKEIENLLYLSHVFFIDFAAKDFQ
jgi:hypothetical protein